MALTAAWTLLLAAALTQANAKPLNVLYLIADDLRPQMARAYSQTYMQTPNFDRLASEGLTFQKAMCQQAVCTASRNSFMTGRRPQTTQRYAMNGKYNSFRDVGPDWITMPEHFKNNGYITLGAGKTFHPDQPKNFDEPKSWSQETSYFDYTYYLHKNHSYGGPCPQPPPAHPVASCTKLDTYCGLQEPDDYFYDDTLADHLITSLDTYVRNSSWNDEPFFFMGGFARPHVPWRVPQEFLDLYPADNISLPLRKLGPIDMPNIAYHRQGFYGADSEIHLPNPTQPFDDKLLADIRRHYYAAVTYVDHQVGRVLDQLESSGLADNTIVVLHGDHGFQVGEHASFHKQVNFELGARVPLIIKVPGKAAGQYTSALTELVSIYPTLAELTGTQLHDKLDGKSFSKLFDAPTEPGPIDYAFSQYDHCHNASQLPFDNNLCGNDATHYMGFSVRSPDWRFTRWHAFDWHNNCANLTHTPFAMELYDHRDDDGTNFDKFGNDNVAGYPAFASVIEQLSDVLVNQFGTC